MARTGAEQLIASILVAGWTSPAALARRHGTGFIHHDGSTHQVFAVASIDSALGGAVIADLHEAEASCLPGKAVAHDRHRIYRYACLREEILDIRLIRSIRQISYEKLLHRSNPPKPTLQIRETVCQKAVAESKRKCRRRTQKTRPNPAVRIESWHTLKTSSSPCGRI